MGNAEACLYQLGPTEDMGERRGLKTADFCAGIPCLNENSGEDGKEGTRMPWLIHRNKGVQWLALVTEKVSFSENNSGENAGILLLAPDMYVSGQPNRDIHSNQVNQLGQCPKLPEGFPASSLCDM